MIMCLFADAYLTQFPDHNILVLSHVKEILEQDYTALEEYFEGHTIGLWSSGLHSRSIRKITVAGIQSVWRRPEKFKHFNIVIIDECHLVTIRQSGMYRKFLSSLTANYIGLTATHFRLGHGYIHEGEGALFNKLAYDLSSKDNFNRLVEEGFLTNLIPKSTEMKMNTAGIAMRAGDFVPRGLSQRFDRESVTDIAVKEIIEYGHNYKKWLIFAIDIKHAKHITDALLSHDIEAACVHSKMKEDRDTIVRDFKDCRYRAVVNVDILTTGFDVPSIDLIGMLRPTYSPSLHVQMLGRGLRVSHGKSHCLILDFAGNTKRLGPINDVVVKRKNKGVGDGQPMVKECPECKVLHHISVRVCDVCGYEFKFKTKLEKSAAETEIVRKGKVGYVWQNVLAVRHLRHKKVGKADSIRVRYHLNGAKVDEFICLDHGGPAASRARHWVRWRTPPGVEPPISGTSELEARFYCLKQPTQLLVNLNSKYPRIKNAYFDV